MCCYTIVVVLMLLLLLISVVVPAFVAAKGSRHSRWVLVSARDADTHTKKHRSCRQREADTHISELIDRCCGTVVGVVVASQ